MSGQLLTPKQVADALGYISARTLNRHSQSGLLQPTAVTPGGHYRWDLEDARKQIEDLRRRRLL